MDLRAGAVRDGHLAQDMIRRRRGRLRGGREREQCDEAAARSDGTGNCERVYVIHCANMTWFDRLRAMQRNGPLRARGWVW